MAGLNPKTLVTIRANIFQITSYLNKSGISMNVKIYDKVYETSKISDVTIENKVMKLYGVDSEIYFTIDPIEQEFIMIFDNMILAQMCIDSNKLNKIIRFIKKHYKA